MNNFLKFNSETRNLPQIKLTCPLVDTLFRLHSEVFTKYQEILRECFETALCSTIYFIMISAVIALTRRK